MLTTGYFFMAQLMYADNSAKKLYNGLSYPFVKAHSIKFVTKGLLSRLSY